MERILGPAPALPVALTTPIGTPGPVPRSGAPDSTQMRLPRRMEIRDT